MMILALNFALLMQKSSFLLDKSSFLHRFNPQGFTSLGVLVNAGTIGITIQQGAMVGATRRGTWASDGAVMNFAAIYWGI